MTTLALDLPEKLPAEKCRSIRKKNTIPVQNRWPFLPEVVRVKNPIVSREEWGAMKSRHELKQREAPVSSILVTYTSGEQCDTPPHCRQVVRDLQEYCIKDKGEDDLPYNFIVGGDGNVYEGRGWTATSSDVPKHLDDYDDGNILSVAFAGDYGEDSLQLPTEHMVQARRALVRYGVENKLLKEDRQILTFIIGKI